MGKYFMNATGVMDLDGMLSKNSLSGGAQRSRCSLALKTQLSPIATSGPVYYDGGIRKPTLLE